MSPMPDNRVSHLQMIQDVITRMASNSFLIKGWSLTLTAAIFALAVDREESMIAVIAIVPVITFWLLDAYFLRMERLFRKLYDHVRVGQGDADFSMNISIFFEDDKGIKFDSTRKVAMSETLRLFHGSILMVTIAVIVILLMKSSALVEKKDFWQGKPSSISVIGDTSGESIKSEVSLKSPFSPLQDAKATHSVDEPGVKEMITPSEE